MDFQICILNSLNDIQGGNEQIEKVVVWMDKAVV